MTFGGLLGHRCTLQKRVQVKDRMGQPMDVWEDWRTDVPCRVTRPSGQERTTLVGAEMVEVTHRLYLEASPVLEEPMRVREVTTPDGEVLFREGDILLVRRTSGGQGETHHQEALVRAVK